MHICRLISVILMVIRLYCGGVNLPGFKIPSIPPTTNKTIRFPNDLVEQVEKMIKGENCTFSAFVIAAVRMALEDLAQGENSSTETARTAADDTRHRKI